MKRSFYAMLSLLFVLFAGCGNEDDSSSLIGTWTAQDYRLTEAYQYTRDARFVLNIISNTQAKLAITIITNLNGEETEEPIIRNYTYEYNPPLLTLTNNDSGGITTGTVYSDNLLELNLGSFYGGTVKFTK